MQIGMSTGQQVNRYNLANKQNSAKKTDVAFGNSVDLLVYGGETAVNLLSKFVRDVIKQVVNPKLESDGKPTITVLLEEIGDKGVSITTRDDVDEGVLFKALELTRDPSGDPLTPRSIRQERSDVGNNAHIPIINVDYLEPNQVIN